jgi:hypothetical protein
MPRPETDADSRTQRFRDLLGYLNFSDGSPGARFRTCLNELFSELGTPWNFDGIKTHLLTELTNLAVSNEAAFQHADQARQTIEFTFDTVVPAYLKHHEDLLFHVDSADLCQPFFLAQAFEATLSAAATCSWDNQSRLTAEALRHLNKYGSLRP